MGLDIFDRSMGEWLKPKPRPDIPAPGVKQELADTESAPRPPEPAPEPAPEVPFWEAGDSTTQLLKRQRLEKWRIYQSGRMRG